tara:strand:+ start:474 stop:1064 length:591 start_codon:yes stop_codon:yes gene_type:complete
MDNANGKIKPIMFKKYLIVLIFIVSCEPQEVSNIYKEPNFSNNFVIPTNIEPFNDIRIFAIESSLEDFFNIENINLNEDFSFYVNTQDIPNYIDCGFMNDEVYVEYIDRVFGSLLEATVEIDVVKKGGFYKINDFMINYLFMSEETGTRWRFKTNKPKELLVGNPVYDDNPYRICLSKNVLEKKIIKILKRKNEYL